ncbi:MAG: thioredoxin [bacterium]
MSEFTFTDENFEVEALKEKGLVLVDFWAPWCGPCQVMGPVIEELAKEYAGQGVKIGKLNVDENRLTAGKYNIMSIPTLIFFKNGKKVEQMMGVQDKGKLAEKIKKLL